MFRKNESHRQESIFSFENEVSEAKREKLKKSEGYYFYQTIFSKIKEEEFSILYSEKSGSRPNAPINALVSAMILMAREGWTYEELFEQIDFNIITRTALGLRDLNESPFCEATIFNFQNRIAKHYVKTGIDLFEKVFDGLTKEQIKRLKIDTSIQRSDSTLIGSNIRNYSRLQLLVEVIIRLSRVLTEEEKSRYGEEISPYIKKTSSQYLYRIKGEKIEEELIRIGKVYYVLYTGLVMGYEGGEEIYKIFERVYKEHFAIEGEQVRVKGKEELDSGILQSPDDITATYKKKGKETSKGTAVDVAETANPTNQIQLITDVVVVSNNTDDTKILNKRIEVRKEKTPDLNEIHTDGGYGSEENDKKMEELDIMHVQTAIRGKKEGVEIEIEKTEEDKYFVSCPNQRVESEKAKTKNKAIFDITVCRLCPVYEQCPAYSRKQGKVYYFTEEDYLMKRRKKNITALPPERRTLRANVEATIKEMKYHTRNGKLKLRGLFRIEIYAFARAISINFGRIYRLFTENPAFQQNILQTNSILLAKFVNFTKSMIKNVKFSDTNPNFHVFRCEICLT